MNEPASGLLRLPQATGEQDLRHERLTVLGILGLVILLQFELVFNRPVNWDEAHHLSQVHALVQGRPIDTLQTLHVRMMAWLPAIGIDEINQIRIARLFMFGFELITLAAIFNLARRFAEPRLALFAPLLYLSAGNAFQHGFSFRADPMVTALLMSALWILACTRLRLLHLAGFTLLLAVAFLSTIKAVLLAPAFAGIAWLRLRESDRAGPLIVKIGLCVLAALGLFAGGVLALQSLQPVVELNSAGNTIKASQDILFAEGLFPRWHYIVIAAGTAPVFFAALLASLWPGSRQGIDPARRVALAGLLLPLACLAFYRNAFPYFYAYLLACVTIGVLPGVVRIAQRYGLRAMAICCLLAALVLSAVTPRGVLDNQRQVISAVHRIFPQPVHYFDFAGMIPAFPKANVFMTTWGQLRYRNGEFESYRAAMRRLDVPLLLANNNVLARNQSDHGPAWELLEDDAAALREGYVHHWGPIWVAGKNFAASSPPTDFNVHAAGNYRLEGNAARIDGRFVQAGSILALAKGTHCFEPVSQGASTLRWGDRPDSITLPEPDGPIYKDF